MGAACEHFLYDKGFGPTNLTLKQYLQSVFRQLDGDEADGAHPHEPTLTPISDDMDMPGLPGHTP